MDQAMAGWPARVAAEAVLIAVAARWMPMC